LKCIYVLRSERCEKLKNTGASSGRKLAPVQIPASQQLNYSGWNQNTAGILAGGLIPAENRPLAAVASSQ
jgi:hypothetical protein